MPLRALIALVVGLFGLASTAAAQGAPAGAHFKNGLIFVDVRVNGASGVFLLDTGAAPRSRAAVATWRRARARRCSWPWPAARGRGSSRW
jgi:hypothetical protein